MPKKMTIEERFWPKVDITGPDDCWEWTAGRHSQGYGLLQTKAGPTYAHRIAWSLTHGDIPDGMCVLHKCDNPPCVNPSHLFLGTQIDNVKDRDRKGRTRFNPLVGEAHPLSKLTADGVREIRQRYASGNASQSELAREHGVTSGVICSVLKHRTWKHVND